MVFFTDFSVCFIFLFCLFYNSDFKVCLAMAREVEVCPRGYSFNMVVYVPPVFGQSVFELSLGLPNIPQFAFIFLAFYLLYLN